MNKKNILSHVGNIQQLAYARQIEYTDGLERGLRAVDIKCGNFAFVLLADKCLDIGELSYKGINFNFLSKPGLMNKGHYDTEGENAVKSIMGGMMFTCGYENICAPCEIEGREYPMHGRMRSTPCSNLSTKAEFIDDDYVIEVSGKVREAELFGENIELNRTVKTSLQSHSIEIIDRIENQSFDVATLMHLYHINFGYPIMDEGTEILIPTTKVVSRDEGTKDKVDKFSIMDAPKDNEPEYVFIHNLCYEDNGDTTVAIYNHNLNLGMSISFNKKYLPYFMQWKTIASGDYCVGLEPSNSSVYGKKFHYENGNIPKIESFDTQEIKLLFTIIDGENEFEKVKNKINNLID